ncbi:MAG: oligosaccharide flippase family protein [Anaerolineales bacterium]|nr:oligosaccharide flippase family protein [Anaerolineales bacterium]
MVEILSAFLKTGLGTVLNLLMGILSTKIFAVYLGPDGVGLFSLLRQTRDTFLSVTTFNGGTALIQGLAQRDETKKKQYGFVVFLIMLVSMSASVLFLLIFAPQIAENVLQRHDPEAISLIRWLSLTIILGTGVMYFNSILNGYRAIGRLALIQVVISAITFVLAYPVSRWVNEGYSIAFIGSILFSTGGGILLAFWLVQREGWLPFTRIVRQNFTFGTFREDSSYFLSFAFTTMITGLATSGTILVIRSLITAQKGLEAAGIFDVAWTLSMMYITIALSSFGTYYLPTFAQSKNNEQRRELIDKILRLTLLIIVPIIVGVLLFKPIVIQLLYTDEFLSSLNILRWMLIADYFKATSWVFGVTITASADKKTLLTTELLWNGGFLSLSVISLSIFNSVELIGIAFGIPYILYLLYNMFYAHKRFGYVVSKIMMLRWLLGAGIILTVSVLTWTDTKMNWWAVLIGFIFISLYFSVSLNRSDYTNFVGYVRKKLSLASRKLS